MECRSCKSLLGKESLSPAPVIYKGQYWQVEHVYPTGVLGWLVIVLRRHEESLHDLTKAEFDELANIQMTLSNILHQELNSKKEYCWEFADTEGFRHIHFHMFAKPNDLDDSNAASKIFGWLTSLSSIPIAEQTVIEFCKIIKQEIDPTKEI